MSENQPAQFSPDGRYYWNGSAWIPLPAQTFVQTEGQWRRTVAVGIVSLIVGAICGSIVTAMVGTIATVGVKSPLTAAAREPPPTSVAQATSTPTEAPRQPITASGQGSKVLPLALGVGNYRLDWSAQGHDNFIVDIHLGSQDQSLVNEIPPSPSAGQTLFSSPETTDYTLQVKASTLTWTITFTPI